MQQREREREIERDVEGDKRKKRVIEETGEKKRTDPQRGDLFYFHTIKESKLAANFVLFIFIPSNYVMLLK